ncbi:MAG: hypothetical protein ACKV2T_08440 [Kofleriaceae bacterium]
MREQRDRASATFASSAQSTRIGDPVWPEQPIAGHIDPQDPTQPADVSSLLHWAESTEPFEQISATSETSSPQTTSSSVGSPLHAGSGHGWTSETVRRPAPAKGLDPLTDFARARREHEGRLHGGHEAVLRPRPAPDVQDPDERLESEHKKGQLYAAASSARAARLSILAVRPLDPARALEIARTACEQAVDHLREARRSEQANPVRRYYKPTELDPEDERFAANDAYANCRLLLDVIATLEDRDSISDTTQLLARHAHLPASFTTVPPADALERIATMSHGIENDGVLLAVTAPFEQAGRTLDDAVDGFLDAQLTMNKDEVIEDTSAAKGPRFFEPAAAKAAPLIRRAVALLDSGHTTANARAPKVIAAIQELHRRAERFAQWAMHGTLVPEAAREVVALVNAVGHHAGLAPLQARELVRGGDTQKGSESSFEQLADAWDAVFDAQGKALRQLANEPAPDAAWEPSLFSKLASLALGTLIGGVAGAAAAVAEQTLAGSRSPGVRGFVANGVETLVGDSLGPMLGARAAGASMDATRKRFFLHQADTLDDYKLVFKSVYVLRVGLETDRMPERRAVLVGMLEGIAKGVASIQAAQQARAVQDWATYLAHQAHGTEVRTGFPGGVEMAGVGDNAEDGRLRKAIVPTGVLAIHVRVVDGAPLVTGSSVGLGAADAMHLSGQRIGSLRMPVQFHITKHVPDNGRDPKVIVSRNEEGTLWLRDMNEGAVEWLGTNAEGALLQAKDIIEMVDDTKLQSVEGR